MNNKFFIKTALAKISLSSINSRIIIGAITVVSGFMLLTGYSLNNAFYNSAFSALEERLTGQVYLLMAVRELNPTNLSPSQSDNSSMELSVDLKQNPYSQLSGFITQADGSILWKSSSSKRIELPPRHLKYQHGEKFFQQYKVNDKAYFSLSITIYWNSEKQDFPLIYHVSDDLSDLNQQISDYQKSIWSQLLIMSITLLITLIFILRWGLKPLREVEQEIKAVEQGQQKLLQKHYPDELTPLTQNINQLIEFERQQQKRYRNALADLAHSLKTPLAIIKGQEFINNKPELYVTNISEAVERMNSIVEYQLQRAAMACPSSHIQYLPLIPVAHTLINSMKKIYRDKTIEFNIDFTPDIEFKIDEGDFMEVLGNLLDNACKWCNNQVNLSIHNHQNELQICVSDDGPGISGDLIKEITKRGVRADQLTPGHGVGLAIVHDIVNLYSGNIQFSSSKNKGLDIKISFKL
jgi:two-component system, OmpR family, sensor histidine kinase PhoQ